MTNNKNVIYRLDTVLEDSMCNRTSVEQLILQRADPKVIDVSRVVVLHIVTKNAVSK